MRAITEGVIDGCSVFRRYDSGIDSAEKLAIDHALVYLACAKSTLEVDECPKREFRSPQGEWLARLSQPIENDVHRFGVILGFRDRGTSRVVTRKRRERLAATVP